jgi:hypothetical protein
VAVSVASAPLRNRRRDRAVLGLDRIHPRVDVREHAIHGTQQALEQIVRVDRVGHADPAELGVEATAPLHGVVVGAAAPEGLDARHVGLSGDPGLDQPTQPLGAAAEAILEDGHQAAAARALAGGDGVHVGQRPRERLLADDVEAALERPGRHRAVEVGRRADVDDVQIVHGHELVEARDAALDTQQAHGELALGLDGVADGNDVVEIGQHPERREMLEADPEPHQADA